MKRIRFDYWTDLRYCGGSNAGGRTFIELNEEEEKSFLDAIQPAKEQGDMLAYFKAHLSPSLSEKIREAIITDFRYETALEVIHRYGAEVFEPEMTDEEFESLSKEELVYRLIAETEYGEDETIVDIEVHK